MKPLNGGNVVRLPLDQIKIGTRLRRVSDAQVENLLLMAEDTGITTPIHVRKNGTAYELIDGAHRLEATRRLGLPDIAAGLVAQLFRQRQSLGILVHQGAIGAALEQVEVQNEFDHLIVASSGDPIVVEGNILSGAQIDPWMKIGLPATRFGLGGAYVLDRRVECRAVLIGLFQGLFDSRRDALLEQFGRGHVPRRELAHDALETRADIVQVAGFRQQVRLGQCHAAACLFEVDPPAHPGLNALLDLLEYLFMLDKVFLSQQKQFTMAQHIVVGPDNLEGSRL